MGCNCVGKTTDRTPIGEPQEGDVLAAASYSPMKKRGPVSGRQYPRVGMGRTLWLDPRDADARPDWWQVVNTDVIEQSPDPQATRQMATPPPPPPVQVRPNFERVMELAQQ